jgi:hypothetical protein
MINLSDVDPIVVAMRSEPFDPDYPLLEIDRDHQPIRVSSYVEYDPVARDDTRRSVEPFEIGRIRPFRLPNFVVNRTNYRAWLSA